MSLSSVFVFFIYFFFLNLWVSEQFVHGTCVDCPFLSFFLFSFLILLVQRSQCLLCFNYIGFPLLPSAHPAPLHLLPVSTWGYLALLRVIFNLTNTTSLWTPCHALWNHSCKWRCGRVALCCSLFGDLDIPGVPLTVASRTGGSEHGETLAILCFYLFVEHLPAFVKSGLLEVEWDHKALH